MSVLQKQLETIRADLEARIPAPALEIMHTATADLVASGQQDRILGVGKQLPNFTLPNHDGISYDSAALLQEKPLVITFYRGLWCPYCNADLTFIGSVQEEVERLGGRLIAISPQLAQWSQQIRERNQLNFSILTDNANNYADKLGLRFRLPDPLLALYRDSFHIDLPAYHGEDSWTLPMPARYVIDRSGIIQYAEASADYTKRPDPDDMLTALRNCH